MLTLKWLHAHVHYNSETGEWTRLTRRGGHAIGTPVGFIAVDREGRQYRFCVLQGKRYKMSRLAVFYTRGRWPTGVVDHKDGDTLNDVWANLRDCSQQQNSCNRRPNSNNKSGHKGVWWCAQRRRWIVILRAAGRRHFLGYFTDRALAAAAYKAGAVKLHGEFARA